MKNIKVSTCILFSILMVSLLSFKVDIETKFTDEEMKEINNEVQKRVEAFIQKEKKDCNEELMKMVNVRVDTILMFDYKELIGQDSLDDTPPRPTPPTKPEILTPNDDTPLQPLIEDEEKIFN